MAMSHSTTELSTNTGGHRLRNAILLLGWTAAALAFLAVYVVDLRVSFPLLSSACQGIDCHYQAIGEAEAAVLANLGLSVSAYAAYILGITVVTVVVFVIMALILLSRLYPRPLGFLFSLMIIIIPTTAITNYDVVVNAFPSWGNAIWLLATAGFALQGLFFITFPNGRLNPRITILIPILWAATFILSTRSDIGVERSIVPFVPDSILIAGFMFVIAGLLAAIIYRYRRVFDRRERQQTKWVIFGLLIFMLSFPVWGYTYEWSAPAPGQSTLLTLVIGWTLAQLLSMVIPVTIFIAMTRHQLWDIDVVVRKTLVYGAVTASLVAVYLGSVILLQNLLTRLTGHGSPIAIVISTLLIAALFNPLRGRVQSLIDRRFFRKRYDAAQTLAGFSAVVRDEVEIDTLTQELIDAVESTLQPDAIAVWIKPDANR